MGEDRLTVGVLSPLLAGSYFGEVLRGITQDVADRGGRVIAVQTFDAEIGDHYPGVAPFASPVAWEHIDGFVVVTRAAPEAFLRDARAAGKPIVMIGHHVPGFKCPEVWPDNASGTAEAVSHLIAHGHERIGFVGQTGSPDIHERYQAYVATMGQNGLTNHGLLFEAPNSCEDGGEQAAEAVLSAGLACTALVVATYLNALGLSRTMRGAGVAVPSRLAIVGLDDRDFASQVSPPLASVHQDLELVSKTAAGLLVDMVHGQTVAVGEQRVAMSLVARSSCGCTKAALLARRPLMAAELPASRFRANLASLLLGAQSGRLGAQSGPDQAAGMAAAIERLVTAYSQASATLAPDTALLRHTAESLFALFPRSETVPAVMECVAQYRRDLLAEEFSPERLEVLDGCSSEVFMALDGARVRALAETSDCFQVSLRNEHYVSLGLVGLQVGPEGLRSTGLRPQSLDWLAGTATKSACLGLWSQPGPEEGAAPSLRVVSVYGRGVGAAATDGPEVPVGAFPPLDTLTSDGSDPDDVLFVLPLRAASRDWGFLALVAPPELAGQTGRDVYFQWAALLGMALDHEALVASLEHQHRDLEEAYRREQGLVAEIRASEERYALAATAANDGLWDWDVANGSVFYSSRWKSMLGFAEDEVGSELSEWFSRAHPDDAHVLKEAVAACLTGGAPPLQLEHRVRARDGAYRWVLCRAATVKAGPGLTVTRMVGSLTDITERKELEERLLHAALYDSLTGLPNRSLFMDRLEQAFARTKRSSEHRFCVLFMDLDGFKIVNDTLGHLFGDLLLIKVAERIADHLRENDTAVRFGGDEFAVLLDGIGSQDQVTAIAQRLQTTLSAPYGIEGHEVVVTVTVGSAYSNTGHEQAEDIVREADAAMYRAKAGKKDQPTPVAATLVAPNAVAANPVAAGPVVAGPVVAASPGPAAMPGAFVAVTSTAR